MIGLFLATVTILRLTTIANAFDGVAGLAAIDIDTGQRIMYQESAGFPLASVVKLPVAIALLQRVDRGEVSLSDKVTLGPDDFHAGASVIADEAKGQPITLSLERLLALMVRDSDNSALDYVLAHYVTPKEVMKALHGIRVKNIDVTRPEAMIVGQILNEGDVIETRTRYAARTKSMSSADAAFGVQKFWHDPRDTATPAGLADLLVKLHKHQAGLKPESEKILLELMVATKSGADRIRAGIPAEATLAHKTGTMPGTLNDAGIITSPDAKHHIVMVVLTKWSRAQEPERAKTVAAMAKAAYEGLTK
jgi:beta-lactamase class A